MLGHKLQNLGSEVHARQIFHTVNLLDSLFQRSVPQPNHRSMASRDMAITEAYKWAGVALAAQFGTGSVGQKDMNRSCPERHLRNSHAIALAAWESAKQKVFGNIAATTSFRVALSLILLGMIPPPMSGSTDRCKVLEEDAEYAFCEGVHRLHALCAQARARLSTNNQDTVPQSGAHRRRSALNTPNLPLLSVEDTRYILELIGAVDWLVNILDAVVIGTSGRRTGTFAPEMSNLRRCRTHETANTPSSSGDGTLRDPSAR